MFHCLVKASFPTFLYFIFSKSKCVFHHLWKKMCVSSSRKENVCFIVSKPLSLTLCHLERRRSEPVDNTAVPNLLHFNLAQYVLHLNLSQYFSVFLSDLFLTFSHFNLSQYYYISTSLSISNTNPIQSTYSLRCKTRLRRHYSDKFPNFQIGSNRSSYKW